MEDVFDNKFTIRNYQRGDYDGIMNLWKLTDLGKPERGDNEATIEGSIEIGGCMLVIVETSTGLICGTSWMTFDGRRIHLHHFGILPLYQGKNLSQPLLKASLEFVKNKGYQVKLEVHKNNFIAINIYKKAGFKYLGDYDVYIIRDLGTIKDDM